MSVQARSCLIRQDKRKEETNYVPAVSFLLHKEFRKLLFIWEREFEYGFNQEGDEYESSVTEQATREQHVSMDSCCLLRK